MTTSQLCLVILALLLTFRSPAFAQTSCPTELYTRWTLVFYGGEIEYRGTLTMNGCIGEMRISFFSTSTQRTEEITQTMTTQPTQGVDGLTIRGSNPLYSGTTVKHPTYSPDTLFYRRTPDGKKIVRTCDEQSPPKCSPVTLLSEANAVRILLQNTCKSQIFVAIRSETYQGRFMRKGWWVLEPGGVVQTDVATVNPNVYFYAYSHGATSSWNGDGEPTSLNRTVQSKAFAAEDAEQLTGAGTTAVNFFRATINVLRPTFTQSFSCSQ